MDTNSFVAFVASCSFYRPLVGSAKSTSRPASSSFVVYRKKRLAISYQQSTQAISTLNMVVSKEPSKTTSKDSKETDEEQVAPNDILQLGIKAVAVGKFGSRPVPPELIPQLIDVLHHLERFPNYELELKRASFLGALFVKSQILDHERILLHYVKCKVNNRPFTVNLDLLKDPEQFGRFGSLEISTANEMVQYICGHAMSVKEHDFAVRVLNKQNFTFEESVELGKIIFGTDKEKDAMRTMITHVMRVRHEQVNELGGLQKALMDLRSAAFGNDTTSHANKPKRMVQIAEQFDGVERCFFASPLLANVIQTKYHMLCVSSTGRSSGPKKGWNLHDVFTNLEKHNAEACKSIKSLADLDAELNRFAPSSSSDSSSGSHPFGLYVEQANLVPVLDRWVDLRRIIIKRPFMAMVEKYVYPALPTVLIWSAFHGSVVDNMVGMAELTNVPATIVTQKGLEGSLTFPITSSGFAIISCSVKTNDGTYMRHSFKYGIEELNQVLADGKHHEKNLPLPIIGDENRVDVVGGNWSKNISMLQNYGKDSSHSEESDRFRKHALCTVYGIQAAMDWIRENIADEYKF